MTDRPGGHVANTTRHIILGTAGHIDHGKTELVKALTGVDTDRLREEKERGISIELGFTRLALPNGDSLGIVDVPGHERFVKTMLAGAAGVDLVLLVVASDEGVMPQTREHMDIVDLLGVKAGVIALTKSDLAEPEEIELAREDVETLVEGTVLQGAPIVPVSSVTRDGIPELLGVLEELARGVEERTAGGPARLPIDRIFTLEGHGTVVTGTLWSGHVSPGDHLEVYPARNPVRIRSVHVHDEPVERAVAGQRTALGLHGIDKDELERGNTVGTSEVLHSTHMIDARLRLVSGIKPMKNRTRVHLHVATAEVLARVVLLESEELGPSQNALVQLRLEEPLVAEKDDLFVIRSYSPMHTIGGGRVIDPTPARHKRMKADVIDSLEVLEVGGSEDVLLKVIGDGGMGGVRVKELPGLVEADVAGEVERLVTEGAVRKKAGRYVTRDRWTELGERIRSELTEYAQRAPLEWGMSAEELRGKIGRGFDRALMDAALAELGDAGELSRRKDLVRWGSAEVKLTPPQQKMAELIERFLDEDDVSPPSLSDLREDVRNEFEGTLKDDQFDALVKLLADEGRIVKVTTTLFFHPSTIEHVRSIIEEHFESDAQLGVPAFKELVGVTRKSAIPLLEYFDREGTTLRQGNVRVRGRGRDA